MQATHKTQYKGRTDFAHPVRTSQEDLLGIPLLSEVRGHGQDASLVDLILWNALCLETSSPTVFNKQFYFTGFSTRLTFISFQLGGGLTLLAYHYCALYNFDLFCTFSCNMSKVV